MTVLDGPQHAPVGYSGPSLPQRVDYPTSYMQLSDLRTSSKRKRANTTTSSTTSLSTPPTLPSDREAGIYVAQALDGCYLDSGGVTLHGPPQNFCANCMVDCNDADCPASSEEKCTDQCIVVRCDDKDECSQVCTEKTCRIENCDGGGRCFGMSDEPFQLLCCTDYHGNSTSISQMNWNSLDDFLSTNECNLGFSGSAHFPACSSQLPNVSSDSMSELHNIHFEASSLGQVTKDYDVPTSTGNPVATPSEPQMPEPRVSETPSQAVPDQYSTDFVCRWSGCNVSFDSLNELVGHVNLAHLRLPSALPQPSKRPRLEASSDSPDNAATGNQDVFPFSCHWDDCHLYPNSSAFPGPSTGLQPEMAFDLLSSHFFHDHLGLSLSPSHLPSLFQSVVPASGEAQHAKNSTGSQSSLNDLTTATAEASRPVVGAQSDGSLNENVQATATAPDEPSYATPAPSPPPDNIIVPATVDPHDCSQSQHICNWASCSKFFSTCADLTVHLAEAHVGSGKGHYDCYWGGCTRNGSHGFASKQKIMRHLQAHTGHRPFVCKECGQHFSEAATLAQHMRRHTQEKPFVCDFPGCGKAFAITGALTIHKRTHNGERPFQCPHCDRAFAESSNLSKHLRTHTGDRPYRCTEPGCGKAFARPDQLQRHRSVHTKNRTGGPVPSPSAILSAGETKSGEMIVVK